MSAAALQFESRPIVRVIREEPAEEKALTAVQTAPLPELQLLCPGTHASLLFYAAQRQVDEIATAICKALVERGACDPRHKDSNGQTAVFFAARDGNAKCLSYLIASGVPPDDRDSAAQTALFYAARDGRTACVEVLLQAGASVNAADNLGQTALFYGARDGRLKTVEAMLFRGADVNVTDRCRRTAAFYAGKNNHHDLVAILQRHGASACEFSEAATTAPTAEATLLPPPVATAASRNNLKRQRTDGGAAAAAAAVPRKCYRLAVKVPPEFGGAARSAPQALVELFERELPHVAVWDRVHQSPVETIFYDSVTTWQALALKVIEELTAQEGGWIFSRPVDCKAWACPDYFDVIKQPMDYSKIRRKFKARQYNRCSEFVSDMALIFNNCFRYNKADSIVAGIARTVQQAFTAALDESGLRDILEQEERLAKWYDGLLQELGIAAEPPAAAGPEDDDSKVQPQQPPQQQQPAENHQSSRLAFKSEDTAGAETEASINGGAPAQTAAASSP